MKRTFKVKTTEAVEIEFDFPVYRKHDLEMDYPNVVVYSRTDETGTVSIKESEGRGTEVEIEVTSLAMSDDADYALGRGRFACSRDEFKQAVLRAGVVLAKRGFTFEFE